MPRLTRRQALSGLGLVIVGAGFGFWGRYALGDNFEDHVAEQLGLELDITTGLLADMRNRIGTADYDTRATAFLFATTEPSRTLSSRGVRQQAIDAFIGPFFGGLVTPLTYAGLRRNTTYTACEVLVRS